MKRTVRNRDLVEFSEKASLEDIVKRISFLMGHVQMSKTDPAEQIEISKKILGKIERRSGTLPERLIQLITENIGKWPIDNMKSHDRIEEDNFSIFFVSSLKFH